MGQSWTLVNFSSYEYVSPHAWGCSFKISEFSYSFDTFAVLYQLLARTDAWRDTCRVAFVGEGTQSPEGQFFEEDDDGSVFCETDLTSIFPDIQSITQGDRKRRVYDNSHPHELIQQIDPTSLPEKVAFVNHSKHRYVVIDTRSIDAFTSAALVWFLADASSASASDIAVDIENIHESDKGDSHMLQAVGKWAYDTVTALPYDETFFPLTLISDDKLLRDVANSFRQDVYPSMREWLIKKSETDNAPTANASEEKEVYKKRPRSADSD